MRYPRLSPRQVTAGLVGSLILSSSLAGTDEAVQREMRMFDSDRNGTISAVEHEQGARQMFATMDANRDGQVTSAEMDAAQAAITGQRDNAKQLSAARKISVIDTDKDGRLSAAEHAAGSQRMFATMDADQDGRLTGQELRSGHERLLRSQEQ